MDQAIRYALDYFDNTFNAFITKLKIETPVLVISELGKTDVVGMDTGLDGGAAKVVETGVSEDEGRHIGALEA